MNGRRAAVRVVKVGALAMRRVDVRNCRRVNMAEVRLKVATVISNQRRTEKNTAH